jgi:anti-sigma B factor antagonist
MLLEIERRTVGADIVVVVLQGRLVLGEASFKVDKLLCDLVHEGARKIVLDLTWLSHIDSAGIGAIAKGKATVEQAGGKLHLAGTTPRVAAALAVSRLDQVFPMYPDPDSACADF